MIGAIRTADAGTPSLEIAQEVAQEIAQEIAQGGNIMQCMEQCIRSEGKSAKDTCKSRCANLSTRPAQPRNCMGVFKACKQNCPKTDRNCHKACKDALMSCS